MANQEYLVDSSYRRLISRSNAASLFWREKVYEIVGNYRRWRSMLSANAAPYYVLIQRRRIQRLVAQAFVEYRRAQAQARLIAELRAQLPATKALIESAQEAALIAHCPPVAWAKKQKK